MRKIRQNTNVHVVIVEIARREIIGNQRSIGGFSMVPLNVTHGLSVDPVGDGSRSRRISVVFQGRRAKRRKLQTLPTTKGT